jgi:hypothetical protein
MKRLLLLVLALLPSQLARAQGPRIPGAIRVDEEHARFFRTDFRNAVTCTGIERSFDGIVWFVVPGGSFRDPVQEKRGEQRIRYWGEWVQPDTIYVAEVRPEWVVRHEVIHYLRNRVDHDDRLNHRCKAPYDSRFEPPPFIAMEDRK